MSLTINRIGGSGGVSESNAILMAHVPTGSTVTASKGGVILTPKMWVSGSTADEDVAMFIFSPIQLDSTTPWTITATDEELEFTKSASVLIAENKEYEVTIIFRFYFVEDGQLVPGSLVGRTYAVITQAQDYLRFASNGNAVALTTSKEMINLSEYSNLVLKLTSDGTRYGQSWYTSSNVPVLGVSTVLPTVSGEAVSTVTLKTFLKTETGVITGADFSVNVSDRTDSMYIVLTVSGSSSLSGTSGYINILDLYLE